LACPLGCFATGRIWGCCRRCGTGLPGAGRRRQFTDEDLAAITAALQIERRYDITPAALAFGLRVLTEPAVRAAVADLGRRTGHVPATPGRALDFEKERALRALGALRGPGRS